MRDMEVPQQTPVIWSHRTHGDNIETYPFGHGRWKITSTSIIVFVLL